MASRKIKAIGTHTYFGGILLGAAAAGIDVVGSVETWKQGIEAVQHTKHYTLFAPGSEMPPVDLVIGNPPCTRFSHMLQGLKQIKSMVIDDASGFEELQDLLNTVNATGARALWWETGPLLWTRGIGMVETLHKQLETMWGPTMTVVVRADPRTAGVPQRRPRCHIISVAGRDSQSVTFDFTKYAATSVPSVGEYLEERIDEDEMVPVNFSAKNRNHLTAMEWAEWNLANNTFASTRPVMVQHDDNRVPAVVSGRAFIWEDKKRWWSIEEYAAMMGIYGPALRNVIQHMDVKKVQQLCSKGVCTHLAEYVAKTFVIPMMESPVVKQPLGSRILQCDVKHLVNNKGSRHGE